MLIEEAREKIRTTQLINRLQKHALGEVGMTPTQVRAVEILLRKRIPDLSAVEYQGEVTHRYVARVPAPVAQVDEWERKYSGGTSSQNPTLQ